MMHLKGYGFLGTALERVKNISPELASVMGTAAEFIPYAGKVLSMIKVERLSKRVKDHSKHLKKIAQLNSSSNMSSDYITERVFPIVLEGLIEEHEDAKINYILTGFENVFIDEKTNESMVINYFDTLRDLRYMDLKRLFYLIDISEEFDFYQQGEEESSVTRNIDKKLENMGLIGKNNFAIWGGNVDPMLRKEDVQIQPYGKSFVRFITNNEYEDKLS